MVPMKIGVYGLGRFGSFWASHLAKSFPVCGYSRSAERPTPPGVERVSLEGLFLQSDAVFLCSAISSMEEVLTEIAPLVRPGQLIADTCSVKVQPSRQMESLLPPAVPLLATHPMFGPDSARDGVVGLPIVLHALRDSQTHLEFWKDTFAGQGMRVLLMSPDEHDKAAAYTQGVTHFIGRVLNDMGLKEHPIATQGYQRLLDIVRQTCNDPFQLFIDLQTANPYTQAMRDDLKRSLEHILSQLE